MTPFQDDVQIDGNLRVGDDPGATNAMVEAHRDGTSTTRPKRGFQVSGELADENSLTNPVDWSVHEATLNGTGGATQGEAVALRATLNLDGNQNLNTGVGVDVQVDKLPTATGQLTEAVGLRIADVNEATNNFAIQTGQGQVRLGDLSGAGDRLVKVDNDGDLAQAAPGTDYLEPDAVTGDLQSGDFPALTGDVTTPGGSLATTIAANAITSTKIAPDAVTSDKIAAGAVGASEIASGAVNTSELANYAVTNTKIANYAVTSDKIATGAVGASEIASGAVNTSELANYAVTNSKIANYAVSRTKMASDTNNKGKVIGYDDATGAVSPLSVYPDRFEIMADQFEMDTPGKYLKVSIDPAQSGGIVAWQSTDDQYDQFSFPIFIAAGTYRLYARGQRASWLGKLTWYVDTTTIVSDQNWYYGSTLVNYVYTSPTFTIDEEGYHVIKGKVNNSATQYYFFALTKVWLKPA